ncbi:MAG: hypothetical protein E6Y63_07520 [Haemophilus parainfluenzae]|uniref:hypothetical protein n=1 Tax=uncultured Haemophilus sp. TaxID=237779 RepID=UPI00280600F4|nr:hypothetical protein [uncultured Haemophilus sp.]MDU4566283.1 hypothetical protein [Haemophilus parainfluenzae]MDU4638128.1 hypothetical protein [Haemophilus parainfluenzae]MDU5990937.1 hypothetical protein [Haemophilus parainfluenzae]
MTTEFNLVLTTESKVLSTNIVEFEKQAEQFLATLTNKFETDDDFAAAKEEVKTLKEVEDKIRAAIKSAQSGEIAALITSAENIAERFRQERLARDKLVKLKESEIKQNIINGALDEISEIRSKYESSVSLALEQTIPKSEITNRLEEATKNKRKLDGLVKSVNAEKTLILAELAQESARITARLKMIPIAYEHLFRDALQLVAGTDDLEPIIAERVNAEQQREAELKAKAEEEAKVKAESQAVASEMETQSAVEKTQENSTACSEDDQELFKFEVRIGLTATRPKAVEFARQVKAHFGLENNVSLKKMN